MLRTKSKEQQFNTESEHEGRPQIDCVSSAHENIALQDNPSSCSVSAARRPQGTVESDAVESNEVLLDMKELSIGCLSLQTPDVVDATIPEIGICAPSEPEAVPSSRPFFSTASPPDSVTLGQRSIDNGRLVVKGPYQRRDSQSNCTVTLTSPQSAALSSRCSDIVGAESSDPVSRRIQEEDRTQLSRESPAFTSRSTCASNGGVTTLLKPKEVYVFDPCVDCVPAMEDEQDFFALGQFAVTREPAGDSKCVHRQLQHKRIPLMSTESKMSTTRMLKENKEVCACCGALNCHCQTRLLTMSSSTPWKLSASVSSLCSTAFCSALCCCHEMRSSEFRVAPERVALPPLSPKSSAANTARSHLGNATATTSAFPVSTHSSKMDGPKLRRRHHPPVPRLMLPWKHTETHYSVLSGTPSVTCVTPDPDWPIISKTLLNVPNFSQ